MIGLLLYSTVAGQVTFVTSSAHPALLFPILPLCVSNAHTSPPRMEAARSERHRHDVTV
jgi:hypothetical protein